MRITILMLSALASASPALAFTSVCDRAEPIKQFLVNTTKRTCEQLTEADLAQIKRIAVPGRKITSLKLSDLADFPNLEILNIKSNKLTSLPEGLLKQLPNLKTLVILGNRELTELPDDFLEGNPKLENLHMFRMGLRTLSESVFARLAAMPNLKVIDADRALNPAERARFEELFPKGGRVELNFY